MDSVRASSRRALRRGRGTAGFTLIECATAMALLLIAIAAAFHTQLTCMNQVRTSEQTLAASADLAAAMDRILLLPTSAIVAADGPFAPEQPIAAFEGLHLIDERIVPTYPGLVAGAPPPDPLEIVLDMTWKDPGGRDRSLSIATMKAR